MPGACWARGRANYCSQESVGGWDRIFLGSSAPSCDGGGDSFVDGVCFCRAAAAHTPFCMTWGHANRKEVDYVYQKTKILPPQERQKNSRSRHSFTSKGRNQEYANRFCGDRSDHQDHEIDRGGSNDLGRINLPKPSQWWLTGGFLSFSALFGGDADNSHHTGTNQALRKRKALRDAESFIRADMPHGDTLTSGTASASRCRRTSLRIREPALLTVRALRA